MRTRIVAGALVVLAATAGGLMLATGRAGHALPTTLSGSSPSTAAELTGLTPATRDAFVAAQRAAGADGQPLALTSGYRTPAHQLRLWNDAVRRYGSEEKARHWVLPPEESQHVRGVALDVRPQDGARWLDRHGAQFGLCRIYSWEWWHFEYRSEWQRTHVCPPPRQH